MDATLISSAASSALALSNAPDTSAAAAPSAMRGADFANLLGHLMNPAGRQDLAATGLQAVPISPQIEVITVAEPMPDAASLLAFARSQGLDDSTLAALFGSTGGDSAAAVGLMGQLGQAPDPTLLKLQQAQVQATQDQGLMAQAPQTQIPQAQIPQAQIPQAQIPQTQIPQAQIPQTQIPQAQIPQIAGSVPGAAPGDAPGVTDLQMPALTLDGARLVYGAAADAIPPGLSPSPPEPLALRPAWSVPSVSQAAESPVSSLDPSSVGAALSAVSLAPQLASAPVLPSTPSSSAHPGLSGRATLSSASALAAQAVGGAALWGSSPDAATLESPAQGPAQELALSQLRWRLADAQAVAAGATTDSEPVQPMLDVLRLRLAPVEAITRRLAESVNVGGPAAWAALTGSAAPAVLAIDMRGLDQVATEAPVNEVLSLDAEGPPAQTGSASPAAPAELSRSAPSSHSAATLGTAAQRAEQYEQLAQRLGEALGQRLQSQIERGQWKMQMRLDPAHLGRIDLELDMGSGGLDAVFRSDNQLTRDLIAQGLPRLRESLNQSGTAVANVWVQGDSSRQSGGNPTPRRAPEPPVQAVGDNSGSQEPVVPAEGNRTRQGTSAWDVLA